MNENYLICCLLIGSKEQQDDIMCSLEKEDFDNYNARTIFVIAKMLWQEKKDIDIVTISDRIKSNKILEYAINTNELLPSSVNYKSYIEIVKRDSNIRKIEFACRNFIDKKNEKSILELEKAINSMNDIPMEKGRKLSEIMTECLNQIDNGGIKHLKTGFNFFDKYVKLENKELTIIGARPSVGKSTFIAQIAKYMAVEEKKNILYFSLEMSTNSIGFRLIANESNTNLSNIYNKANFNRKILKSIKKMSIDNLEIVDDIYNIEEIVSKSKIENSRRKIDCIMIDYLQLISSKQKFNSINERVTFMSRELKILATELDIPIIVLSQLSRGTEKDNRLPVLSDLRDSGSIEQDAGQVIFLHWDKKLSEEIWNEPDSIKLIKCIIAKNRNGSTGTLNFKFTAPNMLFEEINSLKNCDEINDIIKGKKKIKKNELKY